MFRGTFSGDALNIDDQFQFHIKKQVPDFLEIGDNAIATYPTMYLVVPDGETMSRLYSTSILSTAKNGVQLSDLAGI